MRRKQMLTCGIAATFLYVLANVVCAMLYEGYSSISQTVSELSAIDAPTRKLWVPMGILYSLLMIAFGWGVWLSSNGNRLLRIVAILFIADAAIGLFWPPMHRREVIAAGGGTLTDTLHIVFTIIHIPAVMFAIGIGAAALDKKFRIYSVITLAALLVFGVLTGIESPGIDKGLPTPLIGVWERLLIAVYMIWIVVLSLLLLYKPVTPATRAIA